MEQEATPTGGALFQTGSSSLVSDVVALIPSESRPPAFKTGPFHTSKPRKLPTPKNADSQSVTEQ